MFTDLNLNPQINKALEAEKLEQATEVQKKVVPLALKGSDLQISAETGSGKTLAYLIPLMQRMMQPANSQSGSRALILLPTRELAQQTFKECSNLSNFTKVPSVLVIGGQEMRYQASLLRKDPDIIIATPGRITEHLNRRNAILDDIEVLILDEADRMLDMGFREEVMDIISHCNEDRQTLLLSATLNHRGIGRIANEVLKNAQICDLANAQTEHKHIQQKMILSDHPEHKRKQLLKLLQTENFDKAIVFANKRDTVTELESFLRGQELRTNELHGEISQDERKHIMAMFKQGRFDVLVATDVAARGLDIKGVNLVINFDMAHSGDDYIHRIGRTGRAGEKGTAISLIADYEWNLAASIQRYLKQEFERIIVPGLEGKYKGPKKLKSSGKAAGKKKKPKTEVESKKKLRQRDKKNTGKRKSSNKGKTASSISEAAKSGMAPPPRKKS